MADTTVDLQTIPLSELSLRSRSYVAVYLDGNTTLPTSSGLPKNWRGIFHLSGLPHRYAAYLSSKASPTEELINILAREPHRLSFADYRKMLEDIDRWDVLEDTVEFFFDDAVEYLKKQEKFNRSQQQIVETYNREIIPNCITIDDIMLAEQNLPLQRYDAFILYADEDIDFAVELIEKVESFGLKLCVKERDFLAGLGFEHDNIRNLLTERCDRLVVILSPHFVRSSFNEYISNLAQSLGIVQRTRKIIPCLYKDCVVPEIFHHTHLLNYQRSQRFCNVWDKLQRSLQPDREEPILNPCPQINVSVPYQAAVAPANLDDEPNSNNPPVRPPRRNASQHKHRRISQVLIRMRRMTSSWINNGRRNTNVAIVCEGES